MLHNLCVLQLQFCSIGTKSRSKPLINKMANITPHLITEGRSSKVGR